VRSGSVGAEQRQIPFEMLWYRRMDERWLVVGEVFQCGREIVRHVGAHAEDVSVGAAGQPETRSRRAVRIVLPLYPPVIVQSKQGAIVDAKPMDPLQHDT